MVYQGTEKLTQDYTQLSLSHSSSGVCSVIWGMVVSSLHLQLGFAYIRRQSLEVSLSFKQCSLQDIYCY